MPGSFLTETERGRLKRFPEEAPAEDLIADFTLAERDQALVQKPRGAHNRLGVALQVCALRYLGVVPGDLWSAPAAVINPLARQLGGTSAPRRAATHCPPAESGRGCRGRGRRGQPRQPRSGGLAGANSLPALCVPFAPPLPSALLPRCLFLACLSGYGQGGSCGRVDTSPRSIARQAPEASR
jgi:hypothetical protein